MQWKRGFTYPSVKKTQKNVLPKEKDREKSAISQEKTANRMKVVIINIRYAVAF